MAMADTPPPREPKYAGFWLRFGAFLIDTLIVSVIVAIILIAIFGKSYLQLSAQGKTLWADILFQVVLPAIAAILFWRFRGATPGKMLLSAKIVDADTLGPPSTGKLIGRYFAYLVSIVPIFLGFLWIAFDRRKQGWHDKLAGTVVIRSAGD
jgi:uncharacterized RDD family membrane protein YckC